jgi:hypothetical protein
VPRARIRRPLVALIVLIAALAIGYSVRALHNDDDPAPSRTPVPSVSRT